MRRSFRKLARFQWDRGGLGIGILYVLLGGGWILITDGLAQLLAIPPEAFPIYHNIKGWSYVLITGILLYLLIHANNRSLKTVNQQYQLLAENISDVVWILDLDTACFTYISPSIQQLRGLTAKEAMCETPQQTLLPANWADVSGTLPARIRDFKNGDRKIYTDQLEQYRKDGTTVWVEVASRFVVNAESGHLEMYAVSRDITERKQAEEEIRRLNQDLEQRVRDRTDQLEAANKELEAFAYSVSHDLRSPLRHIDGFLELLQQRLTPTLDEPSRHYMQAIASAAKRMGLLIDDLLSFSRMGRHDLARQAVDLNGLVYDAIQELEPETHGRDIQWRIAKLPVVTGDRAMLRVVLVNLISNALKFTRSQPRPDIEIGCEAASATELVCFIRDNGVGFDMSYADKLFGVFQRLHRAEEFEGTGIGLANVRRIIHRHGGRTWAQGEVDRGATFYFSLPQLTPGN